MGMFVFVGRHLEQALPFVYAFLFSNKIDINSDSKIIVSLSYERSLYTVKSVLLHGFRKATCLKGQHLLKLCQTVQQCTYLISHLQLYIYIYIYIYEGASSKRGQVPFENLGDHIVSIKQNFGT